MAAARRLAAIIFTDLAGFTSETHRDEVGALGLLEEQEALLRPLLEAYRGRKIKSMGDGLLLEFPGALDAVECAVALQRAVHERNARSPQRPLNLRIGIHLGDVFERGDDILGDAVNIASRIEPLAEPGGVCISAQVYDQVHHKLEYRLERIGLRQVKGIVEPVSTFRVVLPWEATRASAPDESVPRLAVLPFGNISPDPKDAYFAEGLTEELIGVLSAIRGLRVISRTSTSQYRGASKSVAQIGTELGVGSVLEGSVRKAGDRLRISVQLIDVSTDEHRWTQTYDRQLDNVFDIQLDVAERTAAALKLELLGPEREALHERPTHSLRAYEEFLRGIEASRRLLEGEPKDREVIDHFEAAIREDPEFAAAYCRLAGYLIAIMGVTRSARDVFPRARALVTRAVELNPTSSDALTARGNLLLQADHDWAGAEAVLRESIAINPSDTQAKFWLSVVLRTVGRFDEARAQLRRVIELDPLWIVPRFSLGEMCRSAGDVPEAIRVFEEIERRFGVSWESTGALAFAYASAGRYAEAMERVAPWAGSTEQLPRWMRAGVLTVLGRPEELRKVVEGYERGENSGRYLPQAFLAQWYALLHEKEKALATLEQDDREGDRTLWAHQWSEAFDSLRDEPRFRAILERSGLPVDPHRPLWFPPDHPLA